MEEGEGGTSDGREMDGDKEYTVKKWDTDESGNENRIDTDKSSWGGQGIEWER